MIMTEYGCANTNITNPNDNNSGVVGASLKVFDFIIILLICVCACISVSV